MKSSSRLISACAALMVFAAFVATADDIDPELMQRRQKFKKTVPHEVELEYLLHLPKGYDAAGSKKWPLMLFLHGAGERGDNVAKVAVHGPPKLVKQGKDLPFILVSPQCPEGLRWDDGELLALLDDVMARHKVDSKRVYLTGLSMGGFGTWSLGMRHPDKFAAIAPICGGGNTIDVLLNSRNAKSAIKTLPIWVFHGAKDPVVPLAESERMIAAVKKAGNKDVKLTVYPEAQHDSWTATYDNPELYDWFLAQKLK